MAKESPTVTKEAVENLEWPVYYREVIDVGNIKSNIGVVCQWTERERLSSVLPMNKIAAVGQLYSYNRGISALIRNILLNPVIDTLILCGIDKSGSGKALINFFEQGVDADNIIVDIAGGQLDKELPLEALENIRQKVKLINLRNIWQPEKILPEVEKYYQEKAAWAEPLAFPEPENVVPETLPSERTNYVVRGKFMLDVWPQILAQVMDFGTVKKSQYVEDQRELINVVAEISDDPDKPKLASWLPFSEQELKDYYPQVISGEEVPGVNYTYGQKLFRYSDEGLCVNQIDNIIRQLKSEQYTRRAVAVTWNVISDHNNDHAPCLDLIQALIQEGTLYLTAYLRSNDIYKAWPRNALALRKLQAMLAEGIGVQLGPLTTISCSAHIYASDFADAREMVAKHGRRGTHVWNAAKQACVWTVSENDPRGVMIISLEGDEIVVKQRNWQTGDQLRDFRGQSAIAIYSDLVAANAISNISHALDIGCELQKAEIALTNKLNYTQDQPLKL